MVDKQIATVLAALDASGKTENTLIFFTSDHGDSDAVHRLEHKTVFYDAAARIPLVMSWPGVIPAGVVDDEHLVSNGLDMIPTLCDYTGINIPASLEGLSLKPLGQKKSDPGWREHLPLESEIGHMVMTDRHKYIIYDKGKMQEQLLDRVTDPYEMRNAANDPEQRRALAELRQLYAENAKKKKLVRRAAKLNGSKSGRPVRFLLSG
jgi:choline-sulfatase